MLGRIVAVSFWPYSIKSFRAFSSSLLEYFTVKVLFASLIWVINWLLGANYKHSISFLKSSTVSFV